MKFNTLAFSLTSIAVTAALEIQNFDSATGVDLGASGAIGAPADPNGEIVIGDNQVITGDFQGFSNNSGTKAKVPASKDNKGEDLALAETENAAAKSGAAARASASGSQDVALVAKGAAGASAKIDGSLELKTTDDGSAYVYIKQGAAGKPTTFNLNDGVASVKEGSSVKVVGHAEAHAGVALLAAGKADSSAVVEQKLEFNANGKVTNVKFYASAELKVGIAVNGDIPADCVPIEVYKKPSVSGYVAGSFSAGGWSNDTMTTVTNYVTYCPEPTTITVTTCETEVCGPKEIVVEKETTITLTGECVIPATDVSKNMASVEPKASGGVAATTTGKTDAVAKPGVAAEVSSFNGAGRNVAGAVGIAGILALLI